jgi:hypothetical protein
VARKKIINKKASKDFQQESSMRSKVEIKQPLPHNQEKISRLVGSVFIGLGVLLVAFGIFSFIKYREEPLLDPELEAPKITKMTSLTNEDEISIEGEAKGYDMVFVYEGEEKVGEAKVGDEGEFSFEYIVEDEGEYALQVGGVKGFPNRYISPLSKEELSIVDKTGPSSESVTLKYGPETNKDTFILVGTTEPEATVEVKRGTESFGGIASTDGEFRVEDIRLDEGKNVFSVYVSDIAGNETAIDEKVRVTYTPGGSVNGDAVVDENIPQAAGTLDDLFANNLMMIFGLIALVALFASSSVVYLKNKS